ncbi:amidase signature domain-containing protein [Apiosordaria backusii]|uniref:Amidase signature domain-containing protein n=1 Tax=Apiosordaria backusii TaxID=314023 RepID=A0AA40BLV5_9PEZI|nr:amidase signature domain-containing protein [Apiosordaria backusii]
MAPAPKTKTVLTLPNAKPYAFACPTATTALIIIDIQRDFVDPGGFGSIQCGNEAIFSEARAIVPTVKKVLDAFRSFGGHVIHTREGHQPGLADLPAAKKLRQISNPAGHHTLGIGDQGPMGKLLVRGEYGHDIVDELTPWPDEIVIDKPGKGSFWGTNIHRILLSRGITHLIFTGVTTECCVSTTLRECADRGYQCIVLEDCTQGFDAQQVTTSLDIIAGQDGLFGFVGNSSDLFQAIDKASTDALTRVAAQGLPPIDELLAEYRQGARCPVEVVKSLYERIEQYKAVDPAVWIYLEPKASLVNDALELVDEYKGKPLPPLYGIPFSVKDTIDVAGVPTTAACPKYTYTPEVSAPAVQRVLDAGGLFIGKVNLDQLATGLSGCRSPYGIPHSVFSDKHISGGSSSGSSISVGAKLVSFGLATDTAGSGRVPAAFNGIIGFKPTKGTVSARGLVPACRTLDTITVVAPSIPEARKVWQIIAHHDPDDPYSKLPHTLPTWHIDYRGPRVGGFTFAIPPPALLEVCTKEYRNLFSAAVTTLQSCGGALKEVDYTPFSVAGDLLYEGSLLHERIHCIGHRFLQSNLSSLHPVIRELFYKALSNPPSAYDVFRDQALQAQLTREVQGVFDVLKGGVDVLVVPATTQHPTIEEMEADPLRLNSELGTFTHCANVVDLCGVSVPAGTWRWKEVVEDEDTEREMPFGITFLGGSGYDAKVFDIAGVFEEEMRNRNGL